MKKTNKLSSGETAVTWENIGLIFFGLFIFGLILLGSYIIYRKGVDNGTTNIEYYYSSEETLKNICENVATTTYMSYRDDFLETDSSVINRESIYAIDCSQK